MTSDSGPGLVRDSSPSCIFLQLAPRILLSYSFPTDSPLPTPLGCKSRPEMESLKHTREGAAASPALHRKCQLRRRWWIAIGIAVAIVVILVIVLPLALILPNKGEKGKPSSVIFPLYIYPESNSTWGPLYEAYVCLLSSGNK